MLFSRFFLICVVFVVPCSKGLASTEESSEKPIQNPKIDLSMSNMEIELYEKSGDKTFERSYPNLWNHLQIFSECVDVFIQDLTKHRNNGILLREHTPRENSQYRESIFSEFQKIQLKEICGDLKELNRTGVTNLSSVAPTIIILFQAIEEDQTRFYEKYSNLREKLEKPLSIETTNTLINSQYVFAQSYNSLLSDLYKWLSIAFIELQGVCEATADAHSLIAERLRAKEHDFEVLSARYKKKLIIVNEQKEINKKKKGTSFLKRLHPKSSYR